MKRHIERLREIEKSLSACVGQPQIDRKGGAA